MIKSRVNAAVLLYATGSSGARKDGDEQQRQHDECEYHPQATFFRPPAVFFGAHNIHSLMDHSLTHYDDLGRNLVAKE